ncbi:MAG: hypothetical protein ISR96_12860, partial [Nitrospira sp.]|nr:hypothetical protein [Nitrospira sp.]
MQNDQTAQILNVCESIWQCNICEVHRFLEEKKYGSDLHYRPDLPLPLPHQAPIKKYKIMVIGINPAWNESELGHWEELYKQNTFTDYVQEWKKLIGKSFGRNPFRNGLTSDFNFINEKLGIYGQNEIKKEHREGKDIVSKHIYEYIFWSNLSYCNSPKPYNRGEIFFKQKNIPCNVFSEEIPNCLEQGHLRRLIEIIKPKYILFLTSQALSYMHYKLLLKKLFNLDSYNDILEAHSDNQNMYPSQIRNGKKSANIQLIPCKVQSGAGSTNILFLPHPGYRFNGELKKTAIRDVCDRLQSI